MLEDLYRRLYTQFRIDYMGHFVDEYEGQNKLNRQANLYAVKHTVRLWKEGK